MKNHKLEYTSLMHKDNKFSIEIINIVNEKQIKFEVNEEHNLFSVDDKLVLKFRTGTGVYNIPVIIEKRLTAKMENDYQARVAGKVLVIERRNFSRKELNQSTKYFVDNEMNLGIIANISAVGVKLITKQKLQNNIELDLDLSFADLSFSRVRGQIVWTRKKDNNYINGIKLKFEKVEDQKELEEWLY